jgi:hypothetical protein
MCKGHVNFCFGLVKKKISQEPEIEGQTGEKQKQNFTQGGKVHAK